MMPVESMMLKAVRSRRRSDLAAFYIVECSTAKPLLDGRMQRRRKPRLAFFRMPPKAMDAHNGFHVHFCLVKQLSVLYQNPSGKTTRGKSYT